jgi:NhaP-type Na+/H+ or K+/H+ antiporter
MRTSTIKGVMVAIAGVLMAAYVVFMAIHMARSDQAQQRLLYLSLALGVAVIAAAIGLALGKRR